MTHVDVTRCDLSGVFFCWSEAKSMNKLSEQGIEPQQSLGNKPSVSVELTRQSVTDCIRCLLRSVILLTHPSAFYNAAVAVWKLHLSFLPFMGQEK